MRLRAAVLAVLLASPAGAQTPLPLDPLPRALYTEAQALEAAGDLAEADLRYRAVLRADPTFAQAALDLGRVREALGDPPGAEAAYRMAPPDDVDALLALGRLQLATDRPEDAIRTFGRLRVYETDSAEPLRWLAEATARLDPWRAAALFRDYLEVHDPRRDRIGAARTALAIAEALVAEGDLDGALEVIAATETALPTIAASESWIAGRERLEVRDEARRLARTAAQPLDADQRDRLVSARAALEDGRLAEAAGGLETLLRDARRSPEVWAALADVHEAQGDIAAADRALQVAEALSPFDPRYPAALGDLLATWYGGAQDAAAVAAYTRALRLDPTWADLWFRRALAERRAGDLEAASRSFRRYAELDPRGEHAVEALRDAGGISRARPAPPAVPEAPGCPPDVAEAACRAFWVAVAWQKRGRLDEALAELEGVRAAAPDFVKALNLEASVRLQRDDPEGAIALYRRSLAADPDQDLPLLLLWELLKQRGRDEEARAVLADAETHGAGIAQYLLARDAWEDWRIFEARRRLDAYFATETSGRYHERARTLREDIDRLLRRTGIALLAVLLALVGGIPALWAWRRSGVGLEELLARSPRAYPEVARLGSAIRHEVLKHHTSVLPAVADALDHGDPEPAWWAADRLVGPDSAVERFRGYVRELEVVGRVHGVRLNLRHRDPTLGPLLVAMDRLQALAPELERGDAPGLSDRVRAVSEVLNQSGYRALGALLRRVCLLRLDEALMARAWSAAVAERPGAGEVPLEIGLPDAPVYLRIYRGDLHDVLVNVLRNALEAGAGKVGVRIGVEQDWITGLERAAIRVCDDVPARLTTAMIRGRYIERGLGLTVDRISRSGGSIHVEEEPGWAKAVVVRLPRAEAPELDAEAAPAAPRRAEA